MTNNAMGRTVTIMNRGNGAVQVHKHGCADTKRQARGASVWDLTNVRCLADIVIDVYPPDDFDYDPKTQLGDFSGDIELMPCCPKLADDQEEYTTPGTHRSHKACGHDLTPKARAACRKAGGPKE